MLSPRKVTAETRKATEDNRWPRDARRTVEIRQYTTKVRRQNSGCRLIEFPQNERIPCDFVTQD